MTGDGPWFVSVGETFSDPLNRWDGTTVYVVTDDNGTPKIAKIYWAGQKVVVEPDFD